VTKWRSNLTSKNFLNLQYTKLWFEPKYLQILSTGIKTAFDTGDIIELGIITASIKKVESVIYDARKVPKIHHSPKYLIKKLQIFTQK